MRPAYLGGVVVGIVLLYVAVYGLAMPSFARSLQLTQGFTDNFTSINSATWAKLTTPDASAVITANSGLTIRIPPIATEWLYYTGGLYTVNDYNCAGGFTASLDVASLTTTGTLTLMVANSIPTVANDPWPNSYAYDFAITSMSGYDAYLEQFTNGVKTLIVNDQPISADTGVMTLSWNPTSGLTIALGTDTIYTGGIWALGTSNLYFYFAITDPEGQDVTGTFSSFSLQVTSGISYGTLYVETLYNGNAAANVGFTYSGTSSGSGTTGSSGTWSGTVPIGTYSISGSTYEGANANPVNGISVAIGSTTPDPAVLSYSSSTPVQQTSTVTIYASYEGTDVTGGSWQLNPGYSGVFSNPTTETVTAETTYSIVASYNSLSPQTITVNSQTESSFTPVAGTTYTIYINFGGQTVTPPGGGFDINAFINEPTVRALLFLFGAAITGISAIMAFTNPSSPRRYYPPSPSPGYGY
jgi:hypothetical protein